MSEVVTTPDRRQESGRREADHWAAHEIASVREDLKDQGQRLERLEATVQTIAEDAKTVKEIVESARGFFKVLGVIGHAIKWVAAVAAAVAAIWYLVTGQVPPPSNG